MPRLDQTGPQGFGTRTGRGLGPCCGYSGRYGRMFFSQKEEKDLLVGEKDLLEKELEAVQERIRDIDSRK